MIKNRTPVRKLLREPALFMTTRRRPTTLQIACPAAQVGIVCCTKGGERGGVVYPMHLRYRIVHLERIQHVKGLIGRKATIIGCLAGGDV